MTPTGNFSDAVTNAQPIPRRLSSPSQTVLSKGTPRHEMDESAYRPQTKSTQSAPPLRTFRQQSQPIKSTHGSVPRIPQDVYPPFAEPADDGAARIPAPTRYRSAAPRQTQRATPKSNTTSFQTPSSQYGLSNKPVPATFSHPVGQRSPVTSIGSLSQAGSAVTQLGPPAQSVMQENIQASWNDQRPELEPVAQTLEISPPNNSQQPVTESPWIRISDQ